MEGELRARPIATGGARVRAHIVHALPARADAPPSSPAPAPLLTQLGMEDNAQIDVKLEQQGGRHSERSSGL